MIKKIFCTVVLFSAFQAKAFETKSCMNQTLKWESTPVFISASNAGFPVGDYRTAIQRSIDLWNQNPSKFRFILGFDDPQVGFQNNQNEVWFTDSDDDLNGAPAVAASTYECIDYWVFGVSAKIVEVDVFFDNRENWSPHMSSKFEFEEYGGTKRPITNGGVHEFGHAVGLKHVDYRYNIMGQDYSHIHVNGTKARAYAGEDASAGAVFLYGLTDKNIEDVSVAHWRFEEADDDGYSEHKRVGIYRPDGTEHGNGWTSNDEPRYLVRRGQDVQFEMTYENNGKSRHENVKVGFYISSNARITTADRRIGGITLTLSRNQPVTRKSLITIPDDLTLETTYFIGAIVDEEDQIAEIVERNNASYTPVIVVQ